MDIQAIITNNIVSKQSLYFDLQSFPDYSDLFSNNYVWASLKRILKEGMIEVEDTPEPMEHVATKVLMPEPIPFNGKVVVLGDSGSFYNLSQIDSDFNELGRFFFFHL